MGHTMQVLSFPSPRSTPAEGDVQSATMDLHPSPVDSAQRYHPRSPARASSRESRSPISLFTTQWSGFPTSPLSCFPYLLVPLFHCDRF